MNGNISYFQIYMIWIRKHLHLYVRTNGNVAQVNISQVYAVVNYKELIFLKC